jgi:hypothetical protein
MERIRSSLQLLTGTGRAAFGRENDDTVEFVVFTRDLGELSRLRIITPDPFPVEKYGISDAYFSTVEAVPQAFGQEGPEPETGSNLPIDDTSAKATGQDPKTCLIPATDDKSCLLILTSRDKRDAEGVPILVLRAAVSNESGADKGIS